ncbi:formyltetrahydrofolate deformylase [uncultured Victivallis sp.]|uniref:formyltetrahydrofolate deformylase n=1 Tax=uncultured Victivallis sp. TaxID=354118 RepID=UPI0026002856|nr:formyltetrahydrofolate deformylase [uncultured Victivallis sp.]
MRQVVFLIQTADRKGLLAEISSFFYNSGFNILQCRQFSDVRAERYFMRIALELNAEITRRELEEAFAKFAEKLELEYSVHHLEAKQNVALMVSKASHCLYDLLMHADEGDLVCNIPLIISNHPDLEYVADRFNVPYFCCPMEKGKKAEQEAKVLELLRSHRIDLVVMARYMQILSDDFIAHYPQRIINIHHAFLPAFQGGNPYERAWERGVKMIGATAHYATADLDEGPIIEQDVERISHMDTPEDLKQIGKDIERRVLTRAVRAHLEHRVIVSGRRTIVFS